MKLATWNTWFSHYFVKNNQRNTLHCNTLMLKYLTVFSKANSFGCPDITPFSLCESMCKWTKTEGNRMKTIIPSLYISTIKKKKKHWGEIAISYVKLWFWFLKTILKRNMWKAKLAEEHFKMDTYINFDKVDLERKVTPICRP